MTPQRIDQILDEERKGERRKVEDGEAWARSLEEAAKLFNGGARIYPQYVGFKDGRRTFNL